MTEVRLAVIGVGDVAQRDYLPEFGRLADRATISVVCGRTPERAAAIATEVGAGRWSTDFREVAAAADVDAVVNLTPVFEHHRITRAALAAGKHVYSEKPLGLTAAEARDLDAVATDRGLVLVAAPSVLLFPQVVHVRELLESGALGTVRAATARALGGIPPWEGYHTDPTPFFAAASGPLVDMAVYPLHALTGLLGPARRVAALSQRTRTSFTIGEGPHAGAVVPIESDDLWQVLVELDGCVASVEANFATADSSAPECELRGDRGAVAFSLLDVGAPVSVLLDDGQGWRDVEVAHARAAGPDHILGVEHMVECIRTGAAPIPSAGHAAHVLDILEAARGAAGAAAAIPAGTWRPTTTLGEAVR